jgi:uncharacterized membrane protein
MGVVLGVGVGVFVGVLVGVWDTIKLTAPTQDVPKQFSLLHPAD